MSSLQTVTVEDFSREVLFSAVPVVVDVYADWCGPCRALAPVLDRLAAHYSGRVRFVKVNADEEQDLVSYYRVEGLPTLLLFRDGQLVDRVVGLADMRAIAAKIETLTATTTAVHSQ